MSNDSGISSKAWRALLIALLALWVFSLTTAFAAKRAGTPNSYHNEYSRRIALDATEVLLTIGLLVGNTPRLRPRWRHVVQAALLGGAVVGLVATFRLAAA